MLAAVTKFVTRLKQSPAKVTPFGQACILSLFLHVSLLFVLALLWNLFLATNLYHDPLVFDFVFAPIEEYENSDLQARSLIPGDKAARPPAKDHLSRNVPRTSPQKAGMEPAPQSKQTREVLPKEERVSTRRMLTKEVASAFEPARDRMQTLSEATTEATSVPEVEQTRPDAPYVIHAIKPTALSVPLAGVVRSKPIPAKIAMTRKQVRMLRKKFKKWTENFQKMDLSNSTLSWRHKGKVYTARFQHRPPISSVDIDEVVVEIETEEQGLALSTRVQMRRLAFSNFAQFVDYWDPWVAVHDDVLEGRFHANSKINILESRGVKPKFHGKVTTASFDVNTTGNRPFFDDTSVFLGGLETGVKAIALPRSFAPFLNDSTVAADHMHTFQSEVQVTFHVDGSYTWKALDTMEAQQRRTLPEDAYYIIGNKKKKLHVKGVVKGRVLVYSPGKIIIDDDLTYARHPEVSNVADDYLGLVSEKDVEIAHPSVTGPGDLHIYASIYAKRRFIVRHLRGSGDDTLYIYGSLTAGSLSATEPRYATRVRFDKRLQKVRPPSFPLTDRYEISNWDGKWKVKGNQN
ncbi:MAG: hypothetical protein ACE5IY_12385 [bacterium]